MKRKTLLIQHNSNFGPEFLLATKGKLSPLDFIKRNKDGTISKCDANKKSKHIGFSVGHTKSGGFTECRLYASVLNNFTFYTVAARRLYGDGKEFIKIGYEHKRALTNISTFMGTTNGETVEKMIEDYLYRESGEFGLIYRGKFEPPRVP